MNAESNVTSGTVHVFNIDVWARHGALKIARAQISNPTATRGNCDRMELIAVNAEAVPAVAAEVDITNKPGTTRKRSCRSATEKPKKSRKKSKSNKENNDVLPEAEGGSLNKRSKSTRCLKKSEK
jgi:hypothetical protein